MRILFLHSGDRVPSARFRILPYLSFFRRGGHQAVAASSFPQKYDYFPRLGFRPSQFLKRSVRRLHLLRARWGRFDVVFIDRELFDNDRSDFEEKFRRQTKVLVLDFDDGTGHCSFDFRGEFADGETAENYQVNVCTVSTFTFY